MATLTIRRLDDEVKRRLRVRAAAKGRSMEEEARSIIAAAVPPTAAAPDNLWDAVRAIVDPLGGIELELPPREGEPRAADFSGTTFTGRRKRGS